MWVGICDGQGTAAHLLHLDGDPPEICQATTDEALRLLAHHLAQLAPQPGSA